MRLPSFDPSFLRQRGENVATRRRLRFATAIRSDFSGKGNGERYYLRVNVASNNPRSTLDIPTCIQHIRDKKSRMKLAPRARARARSLRISAYCPAICADVKLCEFTFKRDNFALSESDEPAASRLRVPTGFRRISRVRNANVDIIAINRADQFAAPRNTAMRNRARLARHV
jgi:hypothetical protein